LSGKHGFQDGQLSTRIVQALNEAARRTAPMFCSCMR
jgi:hypothetical protein